MVLGSILPGRRGAREPVDTSFARTGRGVGRAPALPCHADARQERHTAGEETWFSVLADENILIGSDS